MTFVSRIERVMDGRELRSITLGHPLVDAYLEFVGKGPPRGCGRRPRGWMRSSTASGAARP